MNFSKNKNKHLKGKLLAFCAMSFTFGLATSLTATFAWFTITTHGEITSMGIKVTSDVPTLEIGMWNDELNDVDFSEKEYDEEDVDTEKLEISDVSGMFEEDWRNASLEEKQSRDFYPTFSSSYRGSASKTRTRRVTKDENAFVQQEFYLKASDDCDIYLAEGSELVANYEANVKIADEYEGVFASDLNNVVNAARVSVFAVNNERDYYTIINPGVSSETYYGGILDYNGDGYYDYDSTGKEIVYGEYDDGSIIYKDKDVEDIENLPQNNVFKANHKDGIQMWDKENSTIKIKKENSVKMDDIILHEYEGQKFIPPLVRLTKDEVTRIVVSIYLEGRDLYMTNSISMASFNVKLLFTGLFN